MDERNEQAIVELTIHINLDDYKAYHWYWMRKEKPWWPWLMGIFLALVLLCAVWSYELPERSVPLIVFGLALAIGAFTRPRRIYKKKRAAFDAHASYVFFEDHLYVQVNDRGSDNEITAQYSRYLWVAETKSAFYLKTPDKNYIILPKHCMAPEQINALRELLARKFGERFKGMK